MKAKVLACVIVTSLVLLTVACFPPKYAVDRKANIYIGSFKTDKMNAIVGEKSYAEITLELVNAAFDESVVKKDAEISSWFSVSNLDNASQKAQIKAIVKEIGEVHINKSSVKRYDKAVINFEITAKQEADGELSLVIPINALVKDSMPKKDKDKALSSSNKITIMARGLKTIGVSLEPKEVISDYVFGKTDKKEVIVTLSNAVFKDEILKKDILSDKSKWSNYFIVEPSMRNVAENYVFSFSLNGSSKNSVKMLISSKTIIEKLFSADKEKINITIKKTAFNANEHTITPDKDLKISLSFSKTNEKTPAASLSPLDVKKKDIELVQDETKSLKVAVELISDAFKNDVYKASDDVTAWFSTSVSENASFVIEKAVIVRLEESPFSKSEKEKILTKAICDITLKGTNVSSKEEYLNASIPYMEKGNVVLARSEKNLSVLKGIRVLVKAKTS